MKSDTINWKLIFKLSYLEHIIIYLYIKRKTNITKEKKYTDPYTSRIESCNYRIESCKKKKKKILQKSCKPSPF